jgi:hypothetical protein
MTSGHQCAGVKAAGPKLFARVVAVAAGRRKEAAALAREAALKLGFDATQLWIESQRLAATRMPR